MDDKAYRAQKARVEALIEKWVKPVGLGYWRLTFSWYREPLPPYPGKQAPSAPDVVLMDVRADWRYNQAFIRVCLPEVAELDDDHLEWAFVHELMHVFLNEMRYYGDDGRKEHEERVASHLASAFIWLRNHERAQAKRPKRATKVAAS